MLEEMLIRHCSPTLAGIKTGNLFSWGYSCKKELLREIRDLNKRLVPKGVRVLPLRISRQRALIYVYRPGALERDFKDRRRMSLLRHFGYSSCRSQCCVLQLMSRLRAGQDFPHEIGLFLSYPPEDVWGFVCKGACKAKCTGCWKVYGDVQAAKAMFCKFDSCSRIYLSQWSRGKSLEQLTVAA